MINKLGPCIAVLIAVRGTVCKEETALRKLCDCAAESQLDMDVIFRVQKGSMGK